MRHPDAMDPELFTTLQALVPVQRRTLHADESLHQAGERFERLHLVHSGFVKVLSCAADGRHQITALLMKGDWLGFDGIAGGCYTSDAVAMDTSEVWSMRYESLIEAGRCCPALLQALHAAISGALARERESLMAVCTLPADARVAEFLHGFARSLSRRGLRTDQITLRMTRAEIGSHLGLRLESVSRAFTRLARENVIEVDERSRREVGIPNLDGLSRFVQHALTLRSGELQ